MSLPGGGAPEIAERTDSSISIPARMIDSDAAMLARYLDMVRSVPKAQRLVRAMALSAVVRDMALQGATRHSGHLGADAVTERFVLQLYGPEIAHRMAMWLREPGAGSDAR